MTVDIKNGLFSFFENNQYNFVVVNSIYLVPLLKKIGCWNIYFDSNFAHSESINTNFVKSQRLFYIVEKRFKRFLVFKIQISKVWNYKYQKISKDR